MMPEVIPSPEQVEAISPRRVPSAVALPLPDVAAQALTDVGEKQAALSERLKGKAAIAAPAIAGVRTAGEALTKTTAERPEPLVTPPPPSRKLTDFLAPVEGESPMTSISKLISALGVFATGIAGSVKGDARAGLAALSGAMKGWQEGDKERADRAFADWEASTKTMAENWTRKRQAWQDIMESAKLTLEEKTSALRLKMLEEDMTIDPLKADVEGARYLVGVIEAKQKHLDDFAQKSATLIQQKQIADEKIRIEEAKLAEQAKMREQTQRMLEAVTGTGGMAGFEPSVSFAPTGVTVGFKPRTKPKEAIAGLQQSAAILEGVGTMAQQLIVAPTPAQAMRQGLELKTGALLRSNPMAAAYEDSKQAFLGVLSRTLGGERGVLTDRDIKRIDAMLPGFFDTVTIRDMKLGLLSNMLTTATEAQQALLAGQPVPSNFRTRLDALFTQTPTPTTMRIRRTSDGEVFEGPVGPIPAGYEAAP